MTYATTRAAARLCVALGGLFIKQALDKYEPKWLILCVFAFVLAILCFLLETRLKHEGAL